MQRKIHMHDQVKNKVEAVMNHYHPHTLDPWISKFIVMAGCILIGMSM
ncbi:hypothetical protein [Methylosarcina fibrata]|nr:hypothetical protein [Methylosarcina fibrata]